jgi:hypothetical protein
VINKTHAQHGPKDSFCTLQQLATKKVRQPPKSSEARHHPEVGLIDNTLQQFAWRCCIVPECPHVPLLHKVQPSRKSRESKPRRFSLGSTFLILIHHSITSSSCTWIWSWRCSLVKIIAQICRLRTQPRIMWSIVSTACAHIMQSSESWRPCRFLRADVQHRRWSTNQKKELDPWRGCRLLKQLHTKRSPCLLG